LAVGTNDQVLVADSAATNGVKWGTVSATGLASDAVTTAKILDANVTEAKLASDAVTTAKIADDAVTTAKIDDGAVTGVKLAATAAIQPTIVDAKGDIIAATGADAVSRLAVGTNGQFLKADSTQSTGLAWASVAQAISAIDVGYVETSQGTSSSTYTDLATAGPSVTLTTGSSAIVIISGRGNDDANDGASAYMSWEVSGATSISASDSWSWAADQAAFRSFGVNIYKVTTLTPGSNTFTAKYKKAGGSTASFAYRSIMVIAL
jgi:hypothetical protein